MSILTVRRIILIYHFLTNDTVLLVLDMRKRLACRLYLILIDLSRSVGSLQQGQNILDVTVRWRYVNLLQIFNHLTLPSLANLTNLAVHERRPHLIAAFSTDLTPQGKVMVDSDIIETLHMDLIKFPWLMLAQLSVSKILFNSIRADDARPESRIRILDVLRALVAYLAELGDLVEKVGVLVAVQIHLVCQRFLEIVSTEGGILVRSLFLHNKSKYYGLNKG